MFRFIKDNKVGYIDASGNVVMPPKLLYEHGSHEGFGNNSGGEFHDGLLEIGASDGIYVDKVGKEIINKKFYRGWDFSEGLAAAMQNEGGKWGFINTKGEFALSPRFTSSATDYIHSFEGGFALIEVGGRYGYIDHTGEFVIAPRFLMAHSFHD